ncbi:MAG TPA: ABC transporter substrate-binding protein [Ilumatobacteraceae bacterium]|nr:ABC transporter substrate-binding protein [Ilumatobacteraceae bacterium]
MGVVTSHRSGGRRRWLAVATAAALIVAACGDDDSNDDGTTDGTEAAGDDTTPDAGTTVDDTTDDTSDDTTAATEAPDDTGAPAGDARELIIARDMDLTTLDPQRAYCDTCQIFLTAVYQTLIGVDPTDLTVLVPRLADSWEANAESTEFTFTLNPDATFSDGSPVTAADVKFSWERLAGLEGSASYLMSGVTSIEAPDDQTVVVTMEAPNSAFINIVSAPYMGIVSQALAEANGATADETDSAEQWFLSNSAGSGPFVLDSYTEGDQLVLARNDAYWGEPSPFPGVTLKQVKDATAQLQQLQQGDVDIAMQINFDSVGELEGAEGITTELVDSYNFVYVAASAGAVGGEELADPRVREAIKLALDYEGILDTTVGGNGKLQASPIPNGFEGSEGLPLPEQDVAAAEALLAEAGVDGLTLRAAYPSVNVYGVDFDTMMAKVQQDLSAIGIDLELEPVEFAQWVEQITGDGIPFTAVYFAPDHIDSSQYVQYFGMIEGTSWQGRSGADPNADEQQLFADALAASGDAKTDLYNQLGQAMIDDLVIFPLVNPGLVLAYASDITGVRYSACCNLELGGLGID